jgi:hypothetical protein
MEATEKRYHAALKKKLYIAQIGLAKRRGKT